MDYDHGWCGRQRLRHRVAQHCAQYRRTAQRRGHHRRLHVSRDAGGHAERELLLQHRLGRTVALFLGRVGKYRRVGVAAGCPWTAASQTVVDHRSRTAERQRQRRRSILSVARRIPGALQRSGVVTIAGHTYTVTQSAGSAQAYRPPPLAAGVLVRHQLARSDGDGRRRSGGGWRDGWQQLQLERRERRPVGPRHQRLGQR